MMINRILFLILLSSYLQVSAQENARPNDSRLDKSGYFVIAGLQGLRSTHVTYFTGAHLIAGHSVSRSLQLGLGVEYAYNSFHTDNGWNLYNLSFVPVFINAKLAIGSTEKMITPFLELSQGISFVNYRKEDQYRVFKTYHVSEQGYYVYAGLGAYIKITSHIEGIIATGFEGYHMSSNPLEVNPHGIQYNAGFKVDF
jgi:hypothetical protein